jgi:isoleucyl-tRNA synthetase
VAFYFLINMTKQAFKPIDPKPDFPKLEEEVLKFWEENKIFEKSLEQTKAGESFVFFEGPPTANGKPGIHHIEARAFKDLIPRFQTMQGKYVLRKGGWDTHGLPVELEVEKKLGISGKKQIESIKPSVRESIIEFNRLCKESVWQYKDEWERLTRRMGFWVDLENSYVTYHNSYIESIWWIVKQVWDKNLIYLGHKVVPYCTRCGTALSSHEVAQGYKTVFDRSVYVKFKVKNQPNTYILSWTTTPWTLPGNVALAVGADIDYVKIEDNGSFYIFAKERLTALGEVHHNLIEQYKGKDMVGWDYEPLFDVPSLQNDKAYKVYTADFVTTTDGTGVVHTAVMYGEDDYQLGEQLGLPKRHTVDEAGKFTSEVSGLANLYVKDPKTEKLIFELLGDKVWKIENYKHEYPHCWRCSTPLLYYARDSWFIAMSKLRDQLKANNEQINWVPDYIKHGRFGEWLDGVKDWAISRERYWGTPLPIWQCETCKEHTVVGSIKDLNLSKNTFYFSRHAEADHNVNAMISTYPEKETSHITDAGKKRAEDAAKKILELGGVDLIYSSDLQRTKETAEIIGKILGVEIKTDERLREYNMGVYNGQLDEKFDKEFPASTRWDQAPEGGETWKQLQDRIVSFVQEINKNNSGKKILVVSHGDPLWLLNKYYESGREYPQFAEVYELDVAVTDLHRPYIDDVILKCEKCGGNSKRVPAVMDVWFDSGAMPYAQWHYPFDNKEMIDKRKQFPGDFISEAIDQTRGWFYTLVAVSTLLGKGPAFKNVINLGHLLDTKGQKMSKSKGNVIDPWVMINKYGVDSLRWYMYSVNQPGDNKLFGERDAELVLRKNFVILWNVLSFFITYANHDAWEPNKSNAKLEILDEWILAKLQQVTNQVSKSLEEYDTFRAARILEEFMNGLSTWYVRRSRDRKGDAVYQTLYQVLKNLSVLLAPFVPFFTETMWSALKQEGDKESVHLVSWPEQKDLTEEQKKILVQMDIVREAVSVGLAARKEIGIPVRQPLQSLTFAVATKYELSGEFWKLLLDEINVKKLDNTLLDQQSSNIVEFKGSKNIDHFYLNKEITPELKKEGLARELERLIQEMRKKTGLKVGEVVNLTYDTNDGELIAAFQLFDTKKTYINKISKGSGGEEQEIDGKKVAILLAK